MCVLLLCLHSSPSQFSALGTSQTAEPLLQTTAHSSPKGTRIVTSQSQAHESSFKVKAQTAHKNNNGKNPKHMKHRKQHVVTEGKQVNVMYRTTFSMCLENYTIFVLHIVIISSHVGKISFCMIK